MSPVDLFWMAGEALAAHKIRKRLTVAAIAVGVAATLLLTTLGESARAYVMDTFAGLGSNLLAVIPGKVETYGGPPMAGGTTKPLTLKDAEALQRRIPGVIRMVPISVGVSTAKHGRRVRSVTVLGATPDLVPLRNLRIMSGTNLPDIEPDRRSPVCLLGKTIKTELFGSENALGKIIRIEEYRYRVVGVFAPKGTTIGDNLDEVVLIPVANLMQMLNRKGLFRIALQIKNFEEMKHAEERVKKLLIERHKDEDFTIITQQSVMDSLDQILGLLTAALVAIAMISLAVAGIGVMNVMLVSVTERKGEIGLMKAVGASNGQILLVFLAEAAALALTGGVVGILFGILGASLVQELVPALPVVTPFWAVEASLAVALGVGCLFGVLPAWKASRLPPVQALRGRA